jgi:hypothetical protein
MLKIRLRKAHAVIIAIMAGAGAVTRSVAADPPCDQYVISKDGTVSDQRTGLVWQQSLAPAMLWNDAKLFCSSAGQRKLPGCGWRLPSVNELQTIVDDSTSQPAIDSTVFAVDAAGDVLWTSTPVRGGDNAWTINFYSGIPEGKAVTGDSPATSLVRCVRSAQ